MNNGHRNSIGRTGDTEGDNKQKMNPNKENHEAEPATDSSRSDRSDTEQVEPSQGRTHIIRTEDAPVFYLQQSEHGILLHPTTCVA